MQAVQAFTLLREGEERKKYETDKMLYDMVSLHSIAIGNFEHYSRVENNFRMRLVKDQKEKLPPIPAASHDAANAIRSIFSGVRNG